MKIVVASMMDKSVPRQKVEMKTMSPPTNSRSQHKLHQISPLLLVILLASSFVTSLVKCRQLATLSDQSTQQLQPAATNLMVSSSSSSSESPSNSLTSSNSNFNPKGESANKPQTVSEQPLCNLGNDTYQLGERWNPNLPPFGIQVCVLCECIARQRKSCYESKVICRRITNECPIIDSCPDGKGPVTIAGQCCKSCQSTNPQASDAEQAASELMTTTTTPAPSWASVPITTSFMDKSSYTNERVKEFQAIVKALPACVDPKLDASGTAAGGDKHQQQQQRPSAGGHRTTSSKGQKPNNLNGIDSRLAFKSLNAQSGYNSPSGSKGRNQLDKPVASDDSMRQDHQHPNDVQSSGSAGGINNQQQLHYDGTRFVPFQQQQQTTTTRRPMNTTAQQAEGQCTLGTELYQIGDKWNPILPQLGVQVCVLCNCIVRTQRKLACHEVVVTCRRINNDCPRIESCPDGRKPVTVAGQCCKSCQKNDDDDDMGMITTTTTNTPIQTELSQTNDRIMKEYQSMMRSFPSCTKVRDEEKLSGGGTTTTSNTSSKAATSKRSHNARKKRN